ncbi:DUF421 domain-containing protein [Alteromonas pelagimontana]|uniref:DUF421 domain-containing protein n=1 Tax=Alteromonas pelagimontana TaxID=1858656 RepID=A0A6M4M983_9ALTE|nr:YetF domain-containing protein [Alteromonas pelagimontana]QJR79328.1 DUF421 domain-containing protein [Alteromonas pelagimontana]
METVLRAAGMYLVLVVMRLVGRRTLMQMTSFDFILLLIVGEATQQALLTNDHSMTGAMLTIVTLFSIDYILGAWKERSPTAERIIDGTPIILVENGKELSERMKKASVETDEILLASRDSQGLESIDQIKFAVLEKNGRISIIPME